MHVILIYWLDTPSKSAFDLITSSPSKKASIIAVMTATCVASNYALLGFTNVKIMDFIIFVSGFVFGPFTGALIGVMTWMVYGTLNPYGFSLPILVATASSEALYGVLGGILGDRTIHFEGRPLLTNLKFAIVGFLLTFLYDLITNVASALTVGIPIEVALISGIPFSIAHELSNAAFFFVGAAPVIKAIRQVYMEV